MTVEVTISILKMHDSLLIGWLDSSETAGMTALANGSVSTQTSEDQIFQSIQTSEDKDITTRQISTSSK